MGYAGHNATPPRSILVIIGGMIAWAGLVTGFLITTPELHRALMMSEEPVEMTWQQLVDDGLGDNCHVRLVDVQLHEDNPMNFFEEMLEDESPELAQLHENFRQQQAMMMNIAGVEGPELVVYPRGADPETTPAKVVVPYFGWAIDAAYQEIEESGTLTGRFVPTERSAFEDQFSDLVRNAAFNPAMFEADSELADDEIELADGEDKLADDEIDLLEVAGSEVAAVGDEVENSDIAEIAGIAEQPTADVEQAEAEAETTLHYVFEPASSVLPLSDARNWFCLSFLAVAVGLVICGAGGPSMYCCFFFQMPSILSMFGYPMRYGRGTKMTRIVYAFLGLCFISYGYQQMFSVGRIGHLDGEAFNCSLGFIQMSVGAAALLGAMVNTMAERLNISLEPTSGKKFPAPKMTYEKACGMKPTDAIENLNYTDRVLIEEGTASPELEPLTTMLVSLGFAPAKFVHWQRGESSAPAALQLGCQEMVLGETESSEGVPRVVLASVLADGLLVLTFSKGDSTMANMRFGTAAVYSACQREDLQTVLSQHLEQTINIAEKRDTIVVTLDPSELVDFSHFAKRGLAEVMAQYGEAHLDVDAAAYGRFRFPPQPIPQLSSV